MSHCSLRFSVIALTTAVIAGNAFAEPATAEAEATKTEEAKPVGNLHRKALLAQRERGFTQLLGDEAAKQWVGYNKDKWPENWKLEEGVLSRVEGGGDIMTVDKYENFDFRFEWKVSPGGNSGVQYFVSTGDNHPYETGLEYQILDNAKHADGKKALTSAGALYAMYAPTKKTEKPAGEWNQSRIVVRGNAIRHFLNGKRVVNAERDSEDWNRRLKESKFATWKKFAKNREGHIALQDHGDLVWYRNLRIKKLKLQPKKK